jgi:tRNA threonylcarbamoyladenosine biosynthesis protein TsaB
VRILGICTAFDACEAACLDTSTGADVVAREDMRTGHDQHLAPLVQTALRQAGWRVQDLDRIAVVTGPGSFTGLRVGVAFARALALPSAVPVAGVTSLEAMATDAEGGPFLAALPARKRPPDRSWWSQRLDRDGRGEGEPVEVDASELARLSGTVAMVLGQGFEGVALAAEVRPAVPSAGSAARFAARRLEQDLPPARIVYAREPDAAPMRSR